MTRSRLFGRVVGDSALYGISGGIAKALALITVPYLTRALGPEGYGIADLATSTAALLTLVVMFSGDIPAARAHGVANDDLARRRTISSYVWASAMVSLLVAALLLPLGPVIATTFWGADELGWLAALTILLVPLSSIQAALAQTLRIQARPTAFATISLVDLLAQLGLAVGLVAAGAGPAGVVLGFMGGSALGLVVTLIVGWQGIAAAPDRGLAIRLVSIGVRFLPYVTMFVLADWALRSIVANAVGPEGVAELGLAIRVASVLSLLGAAFALAWGPIGLARENDPATARLFGRVLGAYGVASVATALALGAVGPELIPLVAGPGYDGASLILPGFAFAYALAGTEYVLVVAAGVFDRASRVALAATIGAVVQVGVAFLTVPALGAAAVGPVVVLGRGTSFVILMASLRPHVAIGGRSVIVGGAAALLAFVTLQVTLDADVGGAFARWALAAALSATVVVMLARLTRPSAVRAA
jgi:O-antigen/teichoic acid export membrane protein